MLKESGTENPMGTVYRKKVVEFFHLRKKKQKRGGGSEKIYGSPKQIEDKASELKKGNSPSQKGGLWSHQKPSSCIFGGQDDRVIGKKRTDFEHYQMPRGEVAAHTEGKKKGKRLQEKIQLDGLNVKALVPQKRAGLLGVRSNVSLRTERHYF